MGFIMHYDRRFNENKAFYAFHRCLHHSHSYSSRMRHITITEKASKGVEVVSDTDKISFTIIVQ